MVIHPKCPTTIFHFDLIDFNRTIFLQNFSNFLLLCALISITSGSNILFLAPFTAKSHWLYLQSFVKALLEHGHHITCITSNPFDDQNQINYTEILIDPPLNMETIRKIDFDIKIYNFMKKIRINSIQIFLKNFLYEITFLSTKFIN